MEVDSEEIADFVREGVGYLEIVEPLLAELPELSESNPKKVEGVGAIFRAFHSIKGVAGFLHFSEIQSLTHRMESLLDQVRNEKMVLNRLLASVLQDSCDLLARILTAVSGGEGDASFSAERIEMEQKLLGFQPLLTASLSDKNGELNAKRNPESSATVLGILSHPLMGQAFREATSKAMDEADASMLAYLDNPKNPALLGESVQIFHQIHVACASFFRDDASALSDEIEQVIDFFVKIEKIPSPEALAQIFKATGMLRDILSRTNPMEVELITEQITLLSVFRIQEDARIGTKKEKDAFVSNEATNTALQDISKRQGAISIPSGKLDRLVVMIEEVGVLGDGLEHAWKNGSFDQVLFKRNALRIKALTGELQELALSVRMTPLGTLFRKMLRVVSDGADKLGKKVKLNFSGEATEVDRDAADALHDVLVHILRNSLDHGLESPEERALSKKPAMGMVGLEAWHEAGEVHICISDDGKGLSRTQIIKKAQEKKMLTGDSALNPDLLTDAQVWSLIFHPGFSTAAEVTNFSGRGVGMDVARRSVERLKGRIDIESQAGTGTRFTIRLPLNSTLTESLFVRVGQVTYTVRTSMVRETFRVDDQALTTLPSGLEVVNLRGHLYPVIRLGTLHQICEIEKNISEGLLILCENRGHAIAISVDEVIGKVQGAIKALPEIFKDLPYIEGCMVTGSGTNDISWSLDVSAFFTETKV